MISLDLGELTTKNSPLSELYFYLKLESIRSLRYNYF